MINFTKNNSIVADNKVLIGGLTYMLTDDEATKIHDILEGMLSTRNTTSVALNNNTTTATTNTVSESKQSKKSSDKFPELQNLTDTIGFVTVYDGTLVRYWETGYTPKKVKYGIKKSLQEAGAEWDKTTGAYKFKTKKAVSEWIKAQKARQSK